MDRMGRKMRDAVAGWVHRVRARLLHAELVAAGIALAALVVGPTAVLGYGRWADHGVVTIKAVQWAYLPKTITVTEGVPVRLRIVSDDVVHSFAIDGLDVKITELVPGKSESITFTPPKAGTYYFQCTTYCGTRHGKMFGELIVTPRR